MTKFAEDINNANGWIATSWAELNRALASRDAIVTNRICELESALEDANDDNSNLHNKLKEVSGKRDEYRDLVGELVQKTKETCDSLCCGYQSKACMSTLGCDIDAVLTKAKESTP